MKKVKILVPIGCRSDAGLSAPIIKRLNEADWCECTTYNLVPSIFGNNYQFIKDLLIRGYKRDHIPDLVLCVGDRTEMVAAARAAYDNHIKIGHVYAGAMGDTSEKATLDDINRFVISLYADICFCEDFECAERIAKIWAIINKFKYKFGEFSAFWKYNIHTVGITHMDDLEIDEDFIYNFYPYDLVLINAELEPWKWNDSIKLENPMFLESNPDSGFFPEGLTIHAKDLYMNLSRPQFLGLLKNCRKFITNSSSGYYEAPFFLEKEQIVWVGKRNSQRREYKWLETGASDKIVKILEEYFKNV